jgi:hypothetical protein
MNTLRPRIAAVTLVLVNLTFLPPGLWPHLGFAYSLLSNLEARTSWRPYDATLGSLIPIGMSSAVALLDIVGAWWFARRPRVVRQWERLLYAGSSGVMACVHLFVVVLFTFLWLEND